MKHPWPAERKTVVGTVARMGGFLSYNPKKFVGVFPTDNVSNKRTSPFGAKNAHVSVLWQARNRKALCVKLPLLLMPRSLFAKSESPSKSTAGAMTDHHVGTTRPPNHSRHWCTTTPRDNRQKRMHCGV
jgi:hypothetical protein